MGLVTIAQADTYFATRLGASAYWTAETEKEAALETAEEQLRDVYTLPDSAEKLDERITKAICEQAFFLLRDPDVDARSDLIAQGVSANTMDGESYNNAGSGLTPICTRARALLMGFERVRSDAGGLGAAEPTFVQTTPGD